MQVEFAAAGAPFGLARHGIEGSAQRGKRRRFHKHIKLVETKDEFDREVRKRFWASSPITVANSGAITRRRSIGHGGSIADRGPIAHRGSIIANDGSIITPEIVPRAGRGSNAPTAGQIVGMWIVLGHGARFLYRLLSHGRRGQHRDGDNSRTQDVELRHLRSPSDA
jgi:hypothetical protein